MLLATPSFALADWLEVDRVVWPDCIPLDIESRKAAVIATPSFALADWLEVRQEAVYGCCKKASLE